MDANSQVAATNMWIFIFSTHISTFKSRKKGRRAISNRFALWIRNESVKQRDDVGIYGFSAVYLGDTIHEWTVDREYFQRRDHRDFVHDHDRWNTRLIMTCDSLTRPLVSRSRRGEILHANAMPSLSPRYCERKYKVRTQRNEEN